VFIKNESFTAMLLVNHKPGKQQMPAQAVRPCICITATAVAAGWREQPEGNDNLNTP
jgi:hypothetical protein